VEIKIELSLNIPDNGSCISQFEMCRMYEPDDKVGGGRTCRIFGPLAHCSCDFSAYRHPECVSTSHR